MNKAGARFDPDKINWFNHHYMQEQNNYELAEAFKAKRPELKDIDVNYIELVVDLIKERATFVNEFWGLSHFFFVTPEQFDDKAFKKADVIIDFTVPNCTLEILKIASKLKKKVVINFKSPRLADVAKVYANTSKLKRLINWKPRYNNLEFMLKSVIKWEKKINN